MRYATAGAALVVALALGALYSTRVSASPAEFSVSPITLIAPAGAAKPEAAARRALARPLASSLDTSGGRDRVAQPRTTDAMVAAPRTSRGPTAALSSDHREASDERDDDTDDDGGDDAGDE